MVKTALTCWLFSAALALSCSNAATGTVEAGGEDVGQSPADVAPAVDLAGDTGLEAAEIGAPDVLPEILPDVPVEPGCDPGAGCFGELCLENTQCLSGWCGEHIGEGVCTVTCQEECPDGWLCLQVYGSGPDVVYICVSQFPNLCKPCRDDLDCKSLGGMDDVCVRYGALGSFCGGKCAANADCPEGFECKDVVTVSGLETQQCVNPSGECACTNKSIANALDTTCEQANEFGLCEGSRVCKAGGLTPCDAATAGKEVCNGSDDDCDGEVDEPDLVEGDYVNLCDDGNACTADSCLAADGCTNDPLTGTECTDGDPCTVADACDSGTCTGTAVTCDDGNVCTDDACAPTGGCDFVPNTADCDDGDPCTLADECGGGQCAGVPVPCDCKTDADCKAIEDGTVCNGTLVCDLSEIPYRCAVDPATVVTCPEPEGLGAECLKPECAPDSGKCGLVPDHEGLACDDGNPCTLGDACGNGECHGTLPFNCSDDNPCTDDACDPESGCTHVNNQAPCQDGDACTVGDTCSGGVCGPGTAKVCDDLNVCTADACDPQSGCVHTAAAGDCDDGNACTTKDTCSGGVCKGTGVLPCNDGNACTDDACDPDAGCVHQINKAPCDDGNVCTTQDTCAVGVCKGTGVLPCNDGNGCTDDSCDPAAGCVFKPNTAACNDGNPCTTVDVCSGGQCKGSKLPDCSDGNVCTDDSCDPDVGCVHQDNKATCDDKDACTTADVCSLGKCVGALPVSCDDGNPCTDDSCDPAAGCVHLLNAAGCDDGDPCTTGDACTLGKCAGTPVPACGIGQPCQSDFDCLPGIVCEEKMPGGYCLKENCNATGCPAGSSCVFEPLLVNYVCLRDCAVVGDCRAQLGYQCLPDQVCWCGTKVCDPDLPACNGEIATVCDSCGSGYKAGGTDCTASGKYCEDGACLSNLTLIDFNDQVAAGCNWSTSVRLTTQYAAKKVTFAGPTGIDGGAVIDQCGNFGVTGFSGTKFLAFNTSGAYNGGGVPKGPETLTFSQDMSAVKILAGSKSSGTITMTAYNAANQQVATKTIPAQAALTELAVTGSGIRKVVLSFTPQTAVFDDLVFW